MKTEREGKGKEWNGREGSGRDGGREGDKKVVRFWGEVCSIASGRIEAPARWITI
jgi:hypothetical protein